MTDLRKLARSEPCMVRSPVCNFDPQTTVLAHYRLVGVSGIGMKSPDMLGAWACSDCHDLIDGRRRIDGYDRKDVQLLHLQGVMRTQAELIRRGWSLAKGAVMMMLCVVLTIGVPRVCTAPMPAALCYTALERWVEQSLAWHVRQPALTVRTLAGCVPV